MKPHHHQMRVWDGNKFLYLNTTNGFWYSVDSDKCDGEVWPYLSVQHYLKEQCTGKKTAFDELLWEGDLVSCGSGNYPIEYDEDEATYFVNIPGCDRFWLAEYVRFKDTDSGVRCRKVGNIHENPELLDLPKK